MTFLRSCTALLCAMLVAPAVAAKGTTVTVESGTLRGEVVDGVVRFLGVPYAAPPVGDLRWAPPQRPLSWAGQRGATANAPGCLQLVTPDGFGPWTKEYVTPAPVSEDCLYANVWVPAQSDGERRPILVWIHGGAFMSGSNSVPIYDGSELAKKGVIVISINYRLGVFGFAAFREFAGEVGGGANFGLQDIVASLGWIQRNAAAFGGDPKQVTIAGQSAGAMAVHTLLVSPASGGLFSRAIAQSGVIETPLPVREEGYRRGDDLQSRAAVGSLADLRRMPGDRIMALLSQGPLAGTAQIGETSLLGPIIDGHILPDQVAALDASGKRKAVPVMVGLNADEGVLNADYFRTTPQAFVAQVENVAGKKNAERLLAGEAIDGDASGIAITRKMTRLYGLASTIDWAKGNREALYAYYFTHSEPGPGSDMFGAFHSAEIPYVFNSLGASPWRNFADKDRQIAHIMSSYWANFAKSADPNGPGLPNWPKFDRANPAVMELGGRFGPHNPDSEKLALLLDWISKGLGRSIFGLGSLPTSRDTARE